MTHDEWILNLSKYIDIAESHAPATANIVKALRAVVELHKPMLWKNLDNDTSGYKCQGCTWDLYPCPTIQSIEKELTNANL